MVAPAENMHKVKLIKIMTQKLRYIKKRTKKYWKKETQFLPSEPSAWLSLSRCTGETQRMMPPSVLCYLSDGVWTVS